MWGSIFLLIIIFTALPVLLLTLFTHYFFQLMDYLKYDYLQQYRRLQ